MLKEREEYYIKLIKESFSLREVCLKSKICVTTGNYDTLKNVIKNNNINISHFKRSHLFSKSNNVQMNIEDYLNNNTSIRSFSLKNKLFKFGLKEKKCECCGEVEWMGKPINLELHHINGNNTDNRLENLQILCPNCHSYTDNYCGRNQKMNIKIKTCIQCGKEIKHTKSSFCSKECKEKYLYGFEPLTIESVENGIKKCNNKTELSSYLNRSKKVLNSFTNKNNIKFVFGCKKCDNGDERKKYEGSKKYDDLISVFKKNKSFTKTGEYYGVSETFIRKKFKKMGYPYKIKELLLFLEK